MLTTINTHKGLFKYNRLPFGISLAPSIFQRILETLLADIPRVSVYLDDILVSGVDEADHLQTLYTVLKRLVSWIYFEERKVSVWPKICHLPWSCH